MLAVWLAVHGGAGCTVLRTAKANVGCVDLGLVGAGLAGLVAVLRANIVLEKEICAALHAFVGV